MTDGDGQASSSKEKDGWYLLPVDEDDHESIHALFVEPGVFEFLFDGVAPPPAYAGNVIERSADSFARLGYGAWKLVQSDAKLSGLFLLRPQENGTPEMIYALSERYWGQGLATAGALFLLEHGFTSARLQRILAGVDGGHVRSIALLERIGMHRLRNITFPLGTGFEYGIDARDLRPAPPRAILPVSG